MESNIERIRVKEYICDIHDCIEDCESLEDVISSVQALIDKEAYLDSDKSVVRYREESDLEYEIRIRNLLKQEEKERKLLARLKAKYDNCKG